MGITNGTSDDIGSDVGHPAQPMKKALTYAAVGVGGALILYGLIRCEPLPGLVGTVMFTAAVVVLDRMRLAAEAQPCVPIPLPQRSFADRQASATAVAAQPPCSQVIPSMHYCPTPPFEAGTTITFCHAGRIFANVTIGVSSQVQYTDEPPPGADLNLGAAPVNDIMVEREGPDGPFIITAQ